MKSRYSGCTHVLLGTVGCGAALRPLSFHSGRARNKKRLYVLLRRQWQTVTWKDTLNV